MVLAVRQYVVLSRDKGGGRVAAVLAGREGAAEQGLDDPQTEGLVCAD